VAISVQLGYKQYTEELGSGSLDSRVSFTGLDYALFSVTIPTASAPTLVPFQYYSVTFESVGGDVYDQGVYMYGGKSTSGSDTIFYFAYYGMAFIDTLGTQATIYDTVDVISTESGISVVGEFVTNYQKEGYFVGKRQQFDGEIKLTGDAYTTLLDIACSVPYFYIWITVNCDSGSQLIELQYEFNDVEFDSIGCSVKAKPVEDKMVIPDEFKIPVNIKEGAIEYGSTGSSLSSDFRSTIPTAVSLDLADFQYIGDVMNKLISGSKAKVVGFRSTLLQVNDPGDYTYVNIPTFADYDLGVADYTYYLFLAGMSDMMRPNVDSQTVLMVTLDDLLNNLSKIYNGQYTIDDDGYIRFEHIEYFNSLGSSVYDNVVSVTKYSLTRGTPQARRFEYEHRYEYDGTEVHAFGVGYQIFGINDGQFDDVDVIKIQDCGTDWVTALKMNDPTWVGATWPADNVNKYFLTVGALYLGSRPPDPPSGLVSISNTAYHLGWDFLLNNYYKDELPYSKVYNPPDPVRDGRSPLSDVIDEVQSVTPNSFAPDVEIEDIKITNCCIPAIDYGDYIPTTMGNLRITEYRYNIFTNVATIKGSLRLCP